MCLVKVIVDSLGVRVLNVCQTGNDIFRNVKSHKDTVKYLIGAFCKCRVKRTFKLKLLNFVAKLGRSADDKWDNR